MKVIINADDFGYSKEVNTSIEYAILNGCISSSTIIANSPFFSEAIAIAKKYNNISYGVHLNLLEFAPLSNNAIFKKYGLIDENNNFKYRAIFGIKKFSQELKNAIMTEWDMQIKKIIDCGLVISHIDSHQHTHSLYQLNDILVGLLEKYKIYKVRKNTYLSISTIKRIKKYKLPINNEASTHNKKNTFIRKAFNHIVILPTKNLIWNKKIKRHARMCDYLFNYYTFLQEYRNVPKQYNEKIIEIECHPGLNSCFEETKLLMADSLRVFCSDYELISYKNL